MVCMQYAMYDSNVPYISNATLSNYRDDRWMKNYEVLKNRINETGQMPSVKHFSWIGTQRRDFRDSKLKMWKIRKLKELMGWDFNPMLLDIGYTKTENLLIQELQKMMNNMQIH